MFSDLIVDRTSPTGLRRKNGKVAGGKSAGYYMVQIAGKKYYAHRIIMVITKGVSYSGDFVVDHIDGNKLNNVEENLRMVTQMENTWNRKRAKNNCCWVKDRKRWKVTVESQGVRYHVGYFKELSDAEEAAEVKRLEVHNVQN